MTIRVPPRFATWLLQHLGPGYKNESLAGDLFEEYQQERTRAWYWRQAIAAICMGRAMSLRMSLPRLAASVPLRLLTEAAALLGAIALSQQVRHSCASGWMPDIASLVALIAGVGLCVSAGFYVSLCVRSAPRRTPGPRRSTPIKRLIGVFAVTALSAGTATWAGGAARMPQQCTFEGRSPIVSAPEGFHGQVNGN
jgi:hypothetical protein